MRILMLAQNYAPIVGGEERIVEDLSSELADRGHDVTVATISPTGRGYRETREGVLIYGLRSSLFRPRRLHRGGERPQAPPAPDPATVVDLRRVVREKRPQVVHAHNWLVHSYLPLSRDSDAALVVSLHDYGLMCATKRLLHRGSQCSGPQPVKCVRCATGHYAGVKGAAIAMGALTRGPVLRRRVDLFLPVSAEVRDRCGLGKHDRYRIVPNFVRANHRQRAEDARPAALPSQPYVLFLGDITYDKGALHLLKAFATLDRPPPLVLLGRCFIDVPDAPGGVTVVGPWPHDLVRQAIDHCLFTCVPSVWAEPFGLAALESGAAGKAVIASDVGGLPEVVVDGQTGLLVPPGDQNALRAAIARLIEDRRLRERLGRSATRHAAGFSAASIVPLFEDSYQAAVALRRRAAR
jgi:glycosyltransferase involved in cell wall biosynthesis